jgi:hypothetical protein
VSRGRTEHAIQRHLRLLHQPGPLCDLRLDELLHLLRAVANALRALRFKLPDDVLGTQGLDGVVVQTVRDRLRRPLGREQRAPQRRLVARQRLRDCGDVGREILQGVDA